ncbi:apicoplast pyruvate carrier 1-like [Babylonia areolata]|uniref:apicoplast pyruvate carrier 1-like n=1 Tax=Babylonia areolata TaxID=304850 RepID=UPI003FD46945
MMQCSEGRLPVKGILTIVGGFLVHVTLGTQLTYGNMNPYVVSYIRNSSSPSDLRNIDGIWVQAAMQIGMAVSMFMGGILEVRLGPRFATLIGCWFLSAGVLLTYFTVKTSFVTTVMTYGVIFGLGCGASYAIPVGAAMRWFPRHQGVVVGTVFLGFGVGPAVFNQLVTLFVNPDNLSPDIHGAHGDVYFGQPDVLKRVPTLFLTLGVTFATLQFVACLLISDPPVTQNYDLESQVVRNTSAPSGHHSNDAVWMSSSSLPSTSSPSTTSGNEVAEDTPPPTELTPEEREPSPSATSGNEVAEDTPPPTELTPEERETGPEAETDVPPLQMLRTRMFWCLWCMFLLAAFGDVFLVSQYKSYGQTFISDDRFFSIVGSCAAAFNAVGGIFWGWLADRFTFKRAVQILVVLFSSLSYTLSAAEQRGRGFFLVWVSIILFCHSGVFALMPTACGRVFGNRYLGVNYGLLFTSQILTAAVSAFLGQLLVDEIGYQGLFYMIGGSLTLALLIAIVIHPQTPNGELA